jgi:hypothetical protein
LPVVYRERDPAFLACIFHDGELHLHAGERKARLLVALRLRTGRNGDAVAGQRADRSRQVSTQHCEQIEVISLSN